MSKRISIWVCASVITLGAVVAICAVLLVKESTSFRQGLLAKVERDIYEATGARVAVRDFSLDFLPLNLDLYGVVVRGNEPQFGEPLLHADHVGAGIEVRSLRGRRWSLRDLVVDHPVVHLFVDQAGQSNLPQPQSGIRRKATVFDLAVRELRLRDAKVDWNERKIPVDAEFRNLHSTVDFDPGMKRYRGVLKYNEGTIQYDRYAPVAHSLDLSFDAVAAKLTVNHLALASGKSRVAVTGSVEDYNHPAVQGTYEAHLATSDVAPFLPNVSLPVGVVHVVGSASYRRDPSRAALETVSIRGTISSPALTMKTALLQTEISDFGAKYKLAAGNAEVENVRAQVFAGRMTGSVSIHDLAGASAAKLQARLKDASLEALQAAERRRPAPEAQLNGRISADIEATWNRKLEDLAARGNVTLAGTLGRKPAAPLHGVIHADYAAAKQQFTLRQSYLRTAQTSVTMDGTVSEQSQLQLSVRSGNLHEMELLAENFRLAPSGQPVQGLDLYGTASLTGSISGPAGAPHLKGQLEASDLRVKGTRWRLLHTDVDASPSSLSFTNASLEAGSQASEKSQRPEPAATTDARSEGQVSQSRDLATVK